MPQRCYSVNWNPTKTPKYEITAAKGFSLSFISKDPTGQAKSQIGKYGENTPLNIFYCRKKCRQGYYYDFNSISCRRCTFGCAICQKFEECDLCEAAFNKVKKPIHSIHSVDKQMIGLCQLGCQNGFYLNAFDGDCLECDKNCLKCMDSIFILEENYDKNNHNPSFCLDCYQDPDEVTPKKIINMTTGVCQTGCIEKESNGSITIGITREYCHVCGRGCQDCEIPDTSKCLSCSKNFYFQNDTKKCLRLRETLGFWMTTIGIGLFILLISCLWLGLFMMRIFTGGLSPKQRKEKQQHIIAVWKSKRTFTDNLTREEAASIIGKAIRTYLQKRKVQRKFISVNHNKQIQRKVTNFGNLQKPDQKEKGKSEFLLRN